MNNSKKVIQAVVGAALAIAGYVFFQSLFADKPVFDKVLMEAASELNKTCPIMIDQETRLDNAIAVPEKIFRYNYSLVNMVKDSIDAGEILKGIEPSLINNVKSNPAMKTFRENKVTVQYLYKDKNGMFLFQVDVTPDKYN